MNEIFLKRRSIRRFQNKLVEDEKLEEILKACQVAPSWKNLQCWKFIIVKDQKIKADLQNSIPENNPIRVGFLEAPIIIVCCADPEQSGYYNDINYYLVDIGIVIENLCLQAADLGLGTCIVGLFDEKKAKQVLQIPDAQKVVALIPVGYPIREVKPTPRKEITDIVFENIWGRK